MVKLFDVYATVQKCEVGKIFVMFFVSILSSQYYYFHSNIVKYYNVFQIV